MFEMEQKRYVRFITSYILGSSIHMFDELHSKWLSSNGYGGLTFKEFCTKSGFNFDLGDKMLELYNETLHNPEII